MDRDPPINQSTGFAKSGAIQGGFSYGWPLFDRSITARAQLARSGVRVFNSP